uniref:Splicing factor YJU2 n=1 Tax=Elaeophora elaphi TaxID=1147741 RepID=A0A0R3RG61_9BILA
MTGTERKVFQKYYPPDFDPSKIPRAKGQRNRQFVQRVMAPYNMQCDTCHEYIYKGKKFNMRRETADGETYLGLKIFRFYFRCPNCLAEITFKTDLENCDYQQEHGATRLFEAFKLYQQEEKAKETKEEEEKKDPMKMLEKRTKMSRAEMEALGKLEELQETNRRHETFGPDQYFQNLVGAQAEALRLQEEEDEKFIQKLYGRTEDGKVIKRILDDEDEDVELPMHMKQEMKQEPIEEDQKPSCSSTDATDLKTVTSGQGIMAAHKRTSQKELLSRIVTVKKQKVGKNGQIFVKTEIQDTTDNLKDLPERTVLKKFEKNGTERPVPLTPSLSALQGLTDYCSDSSSD